jgi:hypothetical protein
VLLSSPRLSNGDAERHDSRGSTRFANRTSVRCWRGPDYRFRITRPIDPHIAYRNSMLTLLTLDMLSILLRFRPINR